MGAQVAKRNRRIDCREGSPLYRTRAILRTWLRNGFYEGEDAGTVLGGRLPPMYERSGVSKYQYEA